MYLSVNGRGTFSTCSIDTDSAITCPMAQKRKSFDVSFKLKAVETAEKKSKEAAAREFGVDAK